VRSPRFLLGALVGSLITALGATAAVTSKVFSLAKGDAANIKGTPITCVAIGDGVVCGPIRRSSYYAVAVDGKFARVIHFRDSRSRIEHKVRQP
jgi:hypothetical protein